MCSGTFQQLVKDAVKISNFLDFQLSQSSVATYCRCGGNLCGMYIENFPTNHLVKEFWKSVHVCQSYYQTSSSLLFSGHSVESVCDVITQAATPACVWHIEPREQSNCITPIFELDLYYCRTKLCWRVTLLQPRVCQSVRHTLVMRQNQ